MRLKQKDKKQKEQIENENIILENTVKFGKYSFELEQKREESILNQSAKMLTALSVFAAIFYAFVKILYDYKTRSISCSDNIKDEKMFFTLVVIVTICLGLSMIFVILAQWRYEYYEMANINVFYNEFKTHPNKYKYKFQYDTQWKYQFNAMHEKLKKNNDLRIICLKIAMSFFVVVLILMIIFCISFYNFDR